jgi:hypothetical protein
MGLEMRMLTVMPNRDSMAAIVDGDEHGITDTGELLRKETPEFALHWAPLDALLLQMDLRAETLLLDHFLSSRVASIDDGVKCSGEVAQ